VSVKPLSLVELLARFEQDLLFFFGEALVAVLADLVEDLVDLLLAHAIVLLTNVVVLRVADVLAVVRIDVGLLMRNELVARPGPEPAQGRVPLVDEHIDKAYCCSPKVREVRYAVRSSGDAVVEFDKNIEHDKKSRLDGQEEVD